MIRSVLTTQPPRGFTLVELMLAVSLSVLVLAATVSAIMLASKALPDNQSPAQQLLNSSRVLDGIEDELRYAAALLTRQAQCCRFIVQDRTGDGQKDDICYAWSGQPGSPLTRSLNGGGPRVVLESVQSLEFVYWETPIDQEDLPGETGTETLLASYESTGDLKDFPIKDSQYASQYFRPSLPGDALSWRVTRVKVRAKTGGAAEGVTRVQLRSASLGGLPISTVLAEHSLLESSLSEEYLWSETIFPDAPDTPVGMGLCLVLQHESDSESCKVQIKEKNAPSSAGIFAKSTNQGTWWFVENDRALQYYVYGVVTTIASKPQPRRLVDRVSIQLRSGTDGASTACTSVPLSNRPEVIGQ